MKTTIFLTIVFLLVLNSCNRKERTNEPKVRFGLYETVKISDIPISVIDSLKIKNMQQEKDKKLPIIGYILKGDSINSQVDLTKGEIKFIRTFYPVDKEGKYCALVAVKQFPVINNSGIQKTKSKRQNVEIYFNLDGARKWAEMTKNNIGNMVAFTINDQIYAMPYVNAEIKNGVALINGLENEALAKNISASLNASISN
jgi:preprotein translocase subunit SecD